MHAQTVPQFHIHVQDVMFYLDGLFVSQSNAVTADPFAVFSYWGAGMLKGRCQASKSRDVAAKLSEGIQLKRAV